MARASFLTRSFAVLALTLLIAAAALAVLRSFAYLAVASVGLLFLAAALASNATRDPHQRVAALLLVAGVGLTVFGLTFTAIYYLGLGLIASGLALVFLLWLRRT